MMDAAAEIRRDKETGSCFIMFNKNRNGDVENKLFFQLTGSRIIYSNLEARTEGDIEG